MTHGCSQPRDPHIATAHGVNIKNERRSRGDSCLWSKPQLAFGAHATAVNLSPIDDEKRCLPSRSDMRGPTDSSRSTALSKARDGMEPGEPFILAAYQPASALLITPRREDAPSRRQDERVVAARRNIHYHFPRLPYITTFIDAYELTLLRRGDVVAMTHAELA